MKHIFLLAVSAVLLLLASCSETKDESASFGEYLAVKVVGEENWSIIDVNTGCFVCRNEFINRPKQISEDFFFVEKDKGKGYECYDVHNLSSAVNTEPYFSATYYEGGFSPVVYMDTTIIIVNKACKEVGSLAHNIVSAQPFRNGFSVIYTNEREAGLIDTLGNVVIRPQFDVILPMSSDGYAVTCKKMNDTIFNYAIIDSTCAKYYTFTSEKYDPVTGLENGSMAVKKNHKVVYIDRDGNRLFDAGEYVKGTSASYGVFDHMTVYASETGKMGVMTDKGEKLIRDKYDLLVPLRDGNFIAYQNGKCGVIDRNDGRILPFEYESIVKVAADRLVVKEGENRYYIIDMKGNEISKETFTAVALKENSLKSYLESLILIKSSASEQQMMEELRKYAATYSTSQEDIDEQMKDWEREYLGSAQGSRQQGTKTLEEYEASNNDNYSVAPSYSDPYSFVESMIPALQSRRLTNNDIAGLDKSMLRLLRNAIFAKHSYRFKSPDLMEFFTNYSWYSPLYEDVSSSLSSVEINNVNFIKSHE